DFAVVEMGANHQGEIQGYCEYTEPDYGLITNVGLAHLEGFGGFEGVVKGKTELYRFMARSGGTLFLNADNPILVQKAHEAGFKNDRIITYGTGENVFCRGALIEETMIGLKLEGTYIRTNLVGAYNFENVLAACCVAKYFGVSLQNIKTAVENYVPTNQRSQQITWGNNTVILDCYNANPTSMTVALKSFAAMPDKEKIAILGGMKELGNETETAHTEIAEWCTKLGIRNVLFIGEEFRHVNIGKKFKDTSEAAQWLKDNMPSQALILVKGSRAYKLESIFC
ncbi:MAG: UDP-N-acetylmuramoyl-tripeptide--D-alanyl-D-alanine ligase, partial [Chitinophagales bacterium]|nr:UDP-N-acetylmuramoyl-tripeptide--D-alanyl-D-alanine ligase [Chitinophagales bacterium]